MRIRPRLNKQERREMHQDKLKNDMGGTGLMIFENNTDGDLKLPKATDSGIRTVGPRKRFQGDSYFLKWVGSPLNLLKLVEVVVPQMTFQQIQEQNMANEKLLLDQPDTITHQGKIEHVVAQPGQPAQPINDTTDPTLKRPDILLTEDPLDGVEIILG